MPSRNFNLFKLTNPTKTYAVFWYDRATNPLPNKIRSKLRSKFKSYEMKGVLSKLTEEEQYGDHTRLDAKLVGILTGLEEKEVIQICRKMTEDERNAVKSEK